MGVGAGGGERTGNTDNDDLLSCQRAQIQILGDTTGILQLRVIGAMEGLRKCEV
jgi:hypothetical protein